jgi:Phosphoglycerol transferase and related proteins, alkaline phosphatase superfamily
VLVVGLLLLGLVLKQAPAKIRIRSVIYTGILYILSIIHFYAKEDLSFGWQSAILPIGHFPADLSITLGSALAIGVPVAIVLQLIKNNQLTKKTKWTKKNWLTFLISSVLIFGGSLAYTSSAWAMHGIGNMRIDQIVFAMTQPLTGSDPGQIDAFIYQPLFGALLISIPVMSCLLIIVSCSLRLGRKFHYQVANFRGRVTLMVGILGLIIGALMSGKAIGYADIKAYYFESTEIYERNYVDPRNVEMDFPDKKRNLIYIFLESTESSYFSQDVGGIEEHNLMPRLADLAENEGLQFSNREQLGGMLQVPGANQTASSMVAQTSGLPLRPATSVGLSDGSGGNSAEYFPGAYSLGEILQKQGYNQTLLIGSKAEFAGRDQYFKQHGDYKIQDYHWAIEQGLIPEDYFTWWGYEDDKLFDYAKDTLADLSSQDQPFNLTMLTADTHFEDGYATDQTPDVFGDQYSNVIYDADRRITEFLSWLKEQPYYDNTTVILCGDHLTMDSDFFDDIDPDYQRSVFNLFLNVDQAGVRNKNRQFSAVDMFPTTLSALGVKVKGDRLGLGTNLFSDKQTIIEKMGYDAFSSELMKRSDFYDKWFIEPVDKQGQTTTHK